MEFRNKYLGHTSIGNRERLQRWQRVGPGELSAEALARQMLAAYVHQAPP